MSSSDRFEIKGTVKEALKGGQFKVLLENGAECIGTLCGKIRMNQINLHMILLNVE